MRQHRRLCNGYGTAIYNGSIPCRCASNNIGNLLDGVNVFTKTKQLPDEARAALNTIAQAARLNYSAFCFVDNTNCNYRHSE